MEQESNVNSSNLPAQDFTTPAKWSIICLTSYHYHWFLKTCKGKDGDRSRIWSSKNTSVCSQQAGSLICQKQVRHIVEEIVGMDDFTDDPWHASCAGRWMFAFPSNCHNLYHAFLKWLVSFLWIKVTIH